MNEAEGKGMSRYAKTRFSGWNYGRSFTQTPSGRAAWDLFVLGRTPRLTPGTAVRLLQDIFLKNTWSAEQEGYEQLLLLWKGAENLPSEFHVLFAQALAIFLLSFDSLDLSLPAPCRKRYLSAPEESLLKSCINGLISLQISRMESGHTLSPYLLGCLAGIRLRPEAAKTCSALCERRQKEWLQKEEADSLLHSPQISCFEYRLEKPAVRLFYAGSPIEFQLHESFLQAGPVSVPLYLKDPQTRTAWHELAEQWLSA